MKKIQTYCKHSVADAEFNYHLCAVERRKPHIWWAYIAINASDLEIFHHH